MPTRAEEYRAKAAECARKADETPDYVVRKSYEELERLWLDLAEQLDRAFRN